MTRPRQQARTLLWLRWLVVGLLWAGGCGTDAQRAMQPPPPQEPGLLSRSDREPPGVHCAYGGTAIRAGLDRNGNGTLDDHEVERTEYLCDVSTGVLVRKDPVAAGLECPAGGIDIRTGVDDDRDGTLDDTEIDETTRVCSSLELWDRDFTAEDWRDPVKVAALKGARVVAGSLTVSNTEPVALPLLELVTGDLETGFNSPIQMLALRRVTGRLRVFPGSAPALPLLSEVDGNVLIDNLDMRLPALRNIGGFLSVEIDADTGSVAIDTLDRVHGQLFLSGDVTGFHAPALRFVEGALTTFLFSRGAVSLPKLESIGGELSLEGKLTELNLDSLVSIASGIHLNLDFTVRDENVFELSLPSLDSIGGEGLFLTDPTLTRIDLPQLKQLGGIFFLDTRRLAEISLPSLREVSGDISIGLCNALVAADFGALTSVRSLRVWAVPALTTLSLASLRTVTGVSEFDDESFVIRGTALETMDFASLVSVAGGIDLGDSTALRRIRLPVLTEAKELVVTSSPALESVAAPMIETLETLSLEHNALRSLNLVRLGSVTGFARISDTQLADLSGLSALTRVFSLEIDFNPALVSLDGLDWLSEVQGHLFIRLNAGLTSIADLQGLTYVGGTLLLAANAALADLTLPLLTSIGGGLTIVNMPSLTTLAGLDSLVFVGGDLEISFNDQLPAEEIRVFRERLGR